MEQEQATILVVDDSMPAALIVEHRLGRAGYHVILAYGGEEGLARAEECVPNLIVLDVMMPGLDGFEVCEQLKMNPRTCLIPIILLTALCQDKDRIRGIRAGADDFVTKPFNREDLLTRIQSLLHRALPYRIFQEINNELGSELAASEILERIVTKTRKALGASMCSIVICNETPAATEQIISREGQPPAVVGAVTKVVEEGLVDWILREQVGTIIEDASQDRRWPGLSGDTEPIGSAIGVPLAVGDETIGILMLTHALPHRFHSGHFVALAAIACQVATIIKITC